MDLVRMTVAANPPEVNPPYEFYAYDGAASHVVTLVMPLGGTESGLFRYPKVGEQVLVGVQSTGNSFSHYLMGYLPNKDTQPFNAVTNAAEDTAGIIDKQGEVFRYKKSGVSPGADEYSEIGFYRAKGRIEEASVPMDMVNIQSTGDIKAAAANSIRMKAENFSLIAGGDDNGKASMEIDADGNVTINALRSITLKVGRTKLSVSDSGFSVSSKLAESPIANTWDASIRLDPRSGFSASGINCSLKAVKKSSMADGMGGSVVTNMGVGNISGRELMMETYNSTEYGFFVLFNGIEFVQNMAALINGMQYSDRKSALSRQHAGDGNAARIALEAKEDAKNDADAALERLIAARKTDNWANAYNDARAKQGIYKQKIDEAKQTVMDKEEDRGAIAAIVFSWIGFLKDLFEAGRSVVKEWGDLKDTKEKAREMEAEAAARRRGLSRTAWNRYSEAGKKADRKREKKESGPGFYKTGGEENLHP